MKASLPRTFRRAAGAVVAVIMAMAVVAGAGGSASATAGRSAATAVRGGAAHIPAVLPCASLVQNGFGTVPGVPDFSAIPGAPTRISSATVVAATDTAPEYCDVHGYIASQVQFQLKLPTTTWQGRYLQSGCGGYCGTVNPATFPSCDAALGGDFALASTDDGHNAGVFDAVWGSQSEQLREDFFFLAVHKLSLAAKAILRGYYGTAPHYSYFSGCSEGGREGLMEAQRYPDDFDGIIAGAPAMYFPYLPAESSAWAARANTGADGAPIITADKLAALHAAVIQRCDGLDGLVDSQIDDPRICPFDPASIQCPAGADNPTCLTPAQVKTARLEYQAPHDSRGQVLYPGRMEPGSELAWPFWVVPVAPGVPTATATAADNWLRYLAYPVGRPGATLAKWDFTAREFFSLRAEGHKASALDADLSAFRAAGGKLILYHGWADPAIPATGTTTYFQALQDRMGGTGGFARLFMFPGMNHCSGGGPAPDSSDLVAHLVDWVEQGTAPDRLIGAQTDAQGKVVRTRPVFPYPATARYDGSGSIDDAANFVAGPPTPGIDDHVKWLGSNLY